MNKRNGYTMLIKHDTNTNAIYITLRPVKGEKRAVIHTKQVHPWLLVDYAAAGYIFGIEVLDASKHPIEDVSKELFGDSDFGRKIRLAATSHRKVVAKAKTVSK